jgi:hypothetical protein
MKKISAKNFEIRTIAEYKASPCLLVSGQVSLSVPLNEQNDFAQKWSAKQAHKLL